MAQVNGSGPLACGLGWHRVGVYYGHWGCFRARGGDPPLGGGGDLSEVHCAHSITDLVTRAQDKVIVITVFKFPEPCFLSAIEL